MNNKHTSAMCNDSHKKSLKLRTETKMLIDRMLLDGIKITKAEVMRQMGISNGFVNSKEISDYIKNAIKKQEESDFRVDINLQNTILYRKLLSSYIFQYALLDEQEAFLKIAIKDLREKNIIPEDQKGESN